MSAIVHFWPVAGLIPAELTTMVAPSGLVHVPWVAGALPLDAEDAVVVFETFTLSEAVWDTFPDVSVDRADRVWLPFAKAAVFQDQLQLVVPLAVCHDPPSTDTCTLATATLSDAEPETVTVDETVDPEAGDAMATAGGVVSGVGLLTDTDSDAAVETLPEVSVARAATVWLPFARPAVFQDQLQLVVPVAVCHVPPSIDTWTFATATLSEAVPATVAVPDTIAPGAGELNATLGGVVSGED